MPVVIACPSCGVQLGVSEDLLGKPVRCATCGNAFEAVAPPAPDSAYSLEPLPPRAPVEVPRGRGEGLEDRAPRRERGRGEDEDDSEEEWRGRRRDYEPHRGSTILTCGIISIVCAPLALACCQVIAIPGVILGGLSVYWGHLDLRGMREDRLDPAGQGQTNAGWVCGLVGLILNAFALLVLVAVLIFYGVMIFSGKIK